MSANGRLVMAELVPWLVVAVAFAFALLVLKVMYRRWQQKQRAARGKRVRR